MDYAASMNPRSVVDVMLGFVRRNKVEQAVRLARQDMYASNVEDLPAAQERIAAIVKETAEAKRPPDRKAGQGRHLTAES